VFAELVNCTDQDTAERRTAELSDSITTLWDVLMGLEMQLVDQLEVIYYFIFVLFFLLRVDPDPAKRLAFFWMDLDIIKISKCVFF